MKAVKELCRKKTKKWADDRKQKYLLYFDLISGFNNHSVGEEIIPESKSNDKVLKYVNRFRVYMSKIWCLRR